MEAQWEQGKMPREWPEDVAVLAELNDIVGAAIEKISAARDEASHILGTTAIDALSPLELKLLILAIDKHDTGGAKRVLAALKKASAL